MQFGLWGKMEMSQRHAALRSCGFWGLQTSHGFGSRGASRQVQKAAASYRAISSLSQRKHIEGEPAERLCIMLHCAFQFGVCVTGGGKLGTGADAGLSSLAHEHSFHFHVYLNTATCKAVIHHPSIRQYLGDSDSQFSLLSPATATHPSIHISSSQLEM